MSEDKDRHFWERHATQYDRSMSLFGEPLPRAIQRVADVAHGAGAALEVASGTGLFTEALAPVVGELLATDYSEAMVAQTRIRVAHLPNVRCQVRDLFTIGEADGRFDVVVAANVLHLLPDLSGGLGVMWRALKPNGLLVVPTYCHDQDRRSRVVSALLSVVSFPGQRRFSLSSLQAAVQAAGFKIREAELIPGLLPIGFVCGNRLDG